MHHDSPDLYKSKTNIMKKSAHLTIFIGILIIGILNSCSKGKQFNEQDKSISGFPVGYYNFNKDETFNFQLNRWFSLTYLPFEDIARIGPGIEDFGDWKKEILILADSNVLGENYMQAAFYYRAAEFFTKEADPDKQRIYKLFTENFYKAVDTTVLLRHEVPYKETTIQALQLTINDQDKKGTILIHGGFDSFKEELYSMMKFFHMNKYEVITFETPWMGKSRDQKEMGLEIEWEEPVDAVLNYFEATDVTLIGISMGGWLSLRAAAFEPRIKRIIASSVSYDVNQYNVKLARKIADKLFTNKRESVNKSIEKKMAKDLYYAWFVNHLMYVTNKDEPVEAFDVLRTFSAQNLHSDRVLQDVLILTGKEDHMVPYKMHAMQVKALMNAKSITERIFTKDESAQNHCQIGNIGLALNTMLDWIERYEPSR